MTCCSGVPHNVCPVFLLFQLIQTNKLKHYPSIHGDFSSEFRQPCVVFTGHPSLRFGDVVHFMELWGKSSLNTVIFTGNYCCCVILELEGKQNPCDAFFSHQSQTSRTWTPWLLISRYPWNVFIALLTHDSTSIKCRSCWRKSRYDANTWSLYSSQDLCTICIQFKLKMGKPYLVTYRNPWNTDWLFHLSSKKNI